MAEVLLGGLITLLVAWLSFWLASRETRAMMRTFALTLEQLFPDAIVFLRNKKGEIDLSKPARITGKLNATLPSPGVRVEGTIR
jgi:hypothetical protein